jgi:c(7)-type cytochrome triheme protein
MELAITAAMVAAGFAGFAFAVKHLNVFGHGRAQPHVLAVVPEPRPRTTSLSGPGLATLWGLMAIGAILMVVAGRSSPAMASRPQPVSTPAIGLADSNLSLPEAFEFPVGDGSPGQVSFNHETHVPRIEASARACATCHETSFSLRRRGQALAGPVTMERMKKGELCGACHNGAKAFAVDDCTSCHQ